ncbi:MAG: Druantia anti-phage system protein DruA, partial [Burkholderiales bacterium]
MGCLQFSSPAWRMKARNSWIGWDEINRKQHLP